MRRRLLDVFYFLDEQMIPARGLQPVGSLSCYKLFAATSVQGYSKILWATQTGTLTPGYSLQRARSLKETLFQMVTLALFRSWLHEGTKTSTPNIRPTKRLQLVGMDQEDALQQ